MPLHPGKTPLEEAASVYIAHTHNTTSRCTTSWMRWLKRSTPPQYGVRHMSWSAWVCAPDVDGQQAEQVTHFACAPMCASRPCAGRHQLALGSMSQGDWRLTQRMTTIKASDWLGDQGMHPVHVCRETRNAASPAFVRCVHPLRIRAQVVASRQCCGRDLISSSHSGNTRWGV
jgi:hypothetical protein